MASCVQNDSFGNSVILGERWWRPRSFDTHLCHIKIFWNLGTITFMNMSSRDDRNLRLNTHHCKYIQAPLMLFMSLHLQKIHYVITSTALNVICEILIFNSFVGIV